MKLFTRIACCIAAVVLTAAPAASATWTIGPTVGLDIVSGDYLTTAVLSVPSGTTFLGAGLRPGLRVGVWDAAMRHQVFTDVGYLSASDKNITAYTSAFTLNYAYAFHSGSSPYLTAGLGITSSGDGSTNVHSTLLGFGLGRRQRLAHGHGAIRVEVRYDRTRPARSITAPQSAVGVHVGFDLDLN